MKILKIILVIVIVKAKLKVIMEEFLLKELEYLGKVVLTLNLVILIRI